ncbi:hypothetical protein PTKIN_Ptkin10aG0039100 [Pterospermum kingtungense]
MSMQAKHVEAQAETSRGNEVADDKALPRKGKEENEVEETDNVYSIEDAWKAVGAKSPHLRGVDERGDEFIYKFHDDRKLEKEKVILISRKCWPEVLNSIPFLFFLAFIFCSFKTQNMKVILKLCRFW